MFSPSQDLLVWSHDLPRPSLLLPPVQQSSVFFSQEVGRVLGGASVFDPVLISNGFIFTNSARGGVRGVALPSRLVVLLRGVMVK